MEEIKKIGEITISKTDEQINFETQSKSRITPELTNDILYPLLFELKINETIEIKTPYNDKVNERIRLKNSVLGKCKKIILKIKKNSNKRFVFKAQYFSIYIKRTQDGDSSTQINEIFKEQI